MALMRRARSGWMGAAPPVTTSTTDKVRRPIADQSQARAVVASRGAAVFYVTVRGPSLAVLCVAWTRCLSHDAYSIRSRTAGACLLLATGRGRRPPEAAACARHLGLVLDTSVHVREWRLPRPGSKRAAAASCLAQSQSCASQTVKSYLADRRATWLQSRPVEGVTHFRLTHGESGNIRQCEETAEQSQLSLSTRAHNNVGPGLRVSRPDGGN
jgi:hypothetical protein